MADKKYMLKQNTNIADVYQQHKDEDGFLYLLYSEENIYGWKVSNLDVTLSFVWMNFIKN